MKKREVLTVYAIGSIGYRMIEVLWRGRTHWSMALAGGTVLLLLWSVREKGSLIFFLFASAVLITLTEFIFGVIFNIYLNLNVWDYSGMAFNLMGQVCLPYTLLWFALGLPVYYIVGQIKKAVS